MCHETHWLQLDAIPATRKGKEGLIAFSAGLHARTLFILNNSYRINAKGENGNLISALLIRLF